MPVLTAFQPNAFQNNAFQINTGPPTNPYLKLGPSGLRGSQAGVGGLTSGAAHATGLRGRTPTVTNVDED